MSQTTIQLPTPLTAQQITNRGAMLVTAINNASNTKTSKTNAITALQTQLTAAQAQVQTDIGADPQVLAADVMAMNIIQDKITRQSAAYDAAIAKSNSNAEILALDLARGFSIGPISCMVDINGIVTRNDTGTIVPNFKIVPPPLS